MSATPARRPRVLLIAELANPDWVSVPLEGWCHAQALSRVADVHLVTHARNRANILAAGLQEGRDFTALDPERVVHLVNRVVYWMRGGENRAWTLATAADSLLYYGFEWRAWRRFGPALQRREFDLVHRLTPLSPTAVSLLAPRCRRLGVPFMLGPLNGGLPWPAGFDQDRRRQGDWLGYLREGYRLMPGFHSTRRNAAAIVMGSLATLEQLPRRYHPQAVYVPENGLLPERFQRPVSGAVGRPLRVAFVGRLVPYKGADILLRAAAPLARAGRLALDVIGDGPERPRLEALAGELGLGASLRMDGWVRHSELQDRLTRSDVLGFPSVREFGGAVVLEAMALGLVPVVVGYGGPGELVSDATGFRLPVGSRAQLEQRLRDVLERLADDPSQVRPMGERARRRALGLFTWDAKARQMLAVYEWVLGRAPKPDFGRPLADPA